MWRKDDSNGFTFLRYPFSILLLSRIEYLAAPLPSPHPSPLTPQPIKLLLHRRVALREFFDGEVVGLVVGQAQVVFR